MGDDQRTKQLVGAILAGLSFVTAAVLWTGAIIATAINKEALSGESVGMRALSPAFLVFGLIVLIRTLGSRHS